MCKRNYFYDWKALNIDPNTKIFGKAPKIIDEDVNKRESVANALKFVADKSEWNKPLNPIRTKPMPNDFVYGLIQKKAKKEWGVRECVESDIEENRRNLRINHEQYFKKIYGNHQNVISRLDPLRVTAKNLLNASNSQLQMKIHRDFDEIVKVCADAGYPVKQEYVPKIKTILADKFENVCSVVNFNKALDIVSNQ